MAYILTLNEVAKLQLTKNSKETIRKAILTLLKYDNVVIAYLINFVIGRLYKDVILLQSSDLTTTEILPTITTTTSFLNEYLGRSGSYDKALYDSREFVQTLNASLVVKPFLH